MNRDLDYLRIFSNCLIKCFTYFVMWVLIQNEFFIQNTNILSFLAKFWWKDCIFSIYFNRSVWIVFRHQPKLRDFLVLCYILRVSTGPGCLNNFMILCTFGKESRSNVEEGGIKGSTSSPGNRDSESFSKRAIRLLLCVAGLQGSYLTWGILQVGFFVK